jgi:hypothetical protein
MFWLAIEGFPFLRPGAACFCQNSLISEFQKEAHDYFYFHPWKSAFSERQGIAAVYDFEAVLLETLQRSDCSCAFTSVATNHLVIWFLHLPCDLPWNGHSDWLSELKLDIAHSLFDSP